MDQAVALPIGCPSYTQALGLADAWVARADLARHPEALRIDAHLALAVV